MKADFYFSSADSKVFCACTLECFVGASVVHVSISSTIGDGTLSLPSFQDIYNMSSPPHALHDEHGENAQATHDATMDEVEMADHGFVDMVEFGFLVSRTSALEKNLCALNKNVTKMTDDLLQQLVHQQASGVLITPMAVRVMLWSPP